MKNSQGMVISVVLLIFCVLGCGTANRTAGDGRQLKPTTTPRIQIQSEPDGKTGIYHQDFRIIPSLLIDEKPASSEHSFHLFSMASYSGKKAKCEEDSLVFVISHDAADIQSWRFPSNATVGVVIDGSHLPLKIHSQRPYGMPTMSNYMNDPQPFEALTISPSCAMYQQLAKAKSVEFRIGNASFELMPDSVASFREFGNAIGY